LAVENFGYEKSVRTSENVARRARKPRTTDTRAYAVRKFRRRLGLPHPKCRVSAHAVRSNQTNSPLPSTMSRAFPGKEELAERSGCLLSESALVRGASGRRRPGKRVVTARAAGDMQSLERRSRIYHDGSGSADNIPRPRANATSRHTSALALGGSELSRSEAAQRFQVPQNVRKMRSSAWGGLA
jgi:hypothetical protein